MIKWLFPDDAGTAIFFRLKRKRAVMENLFKLNGLNIVYSKNNMTFQ